MMDSFVDCRRLEVFHIYVKHILLVINHNFRSVHVSFYISGLYFWSDVIV